MSRHRAPAPTRPSAAAVVASVALLGASYGEYRVARSAVGRLLDIRPDRWGAA